MVGISLLFISPMQKQTTTNEIFTVHIIDIPKIPAPQVVSTPLEKPSKLPTEPMPKTERRTEKEKDTAVKGKMIEKQETVQKEVPTFSAEKFRESLIAKTEIPPSVEKPSARKTTETASVKVEKIERGPTDITEINISSLMSIPDYYLSSLHKKIKENWKTDNIIGERTAIVSFRIYRDGRIENISLEKSSGNTRFDRSVLEAVIATKQVPPFPAEITHNYLDIIIDFKTEG